MFQITHVNAIVEIIILNEDNKPIAKAAARLNTTAKAAQITTVLFNTWYLL